MPRGCRPCTMTRFLFTTLLATILFFAIGLSFHGWTRIWIYTAFWTVYFIILACGVAFVQLKFFGPVICRGDPHRMCVALSFDDGPDPATTPALLDLLAQEKIPAAFFCIGKNVAANPALTVRIAAEGHLLGNHTFTHPKWISLLSRRELLNEISLAQEQICSATGITPIYMRPPMGLTNPRYAGVLKQLGLQMAGWDVRSMDTRWPPRQVIRRVLRKARPGSIILLHDGGRPPDHVLEITREVIHGLRERGFEFERMDRITIGNNE